jgi:Fe-S oxidoreductase
MARLKAEFLHQYYRKHGLPWRNWVFGHVAKLTRRGGRLGNWWMRSRLGRWLNEKLLGIDRRRVPPALAKKPFDWQALRDKMESGPPVLIFPDTFTTLYEPDVARAAVAVLRRLGCHVEAGLSELRCCGRPMISNGMLDEAVKLARHNVEQLYAWSAAGKPIIACEPSCILTIKDDYPALLRNEERRKAEVVAAVCRTFEEFVEESLQSGGMPLRAGPRKILVQGHCHQRSLVGMAPTLRLLRRIPGAEVIDLDAGCCGMAGSFGYEKEHYEVSRLVGEQRLFPMLRQADTNDAVIAPGFSCRMQIEHFTGRRAAHPSTLLSGLLGQ